MTTYIKDYLEDAQTSQTLEQESPQLRRKLVALAEKLDNQNNEAEQATNNKSPLLPVVDHNTFKQDATKIIDDYIWWVKFWMVVAYFVPVYNVVHAIYCAYQRFANDKHPVKNPLPKFQELKSEIDNGSVTFEKPQLDMSEQSDATSMLQRAGKAVKSRWNNFIGIGKQASAADSTVAPSVDNVPSAQDIQRARTSGKMEMIRSSIMSKEGFVYTYQHSVKVGGKSISAVYAIKMPKKDYMQNLEREAALLQKLDHDKIIGCEFAYKIEDQFCMGLAYADRGTVYGVITDKKNRFNAERSISFAFDVCDAMQFLRDKGVVHGDVKSKNLLLVSNEKDHPIVKLADFGGAFFKNKPRADEHIYSVEYAPENITSTGQDYATDLYSMGCVLFELFSWSVLTKNNAIVADRFMDRLQKAAPPVAPVIRKCLEPAGITFFRELKTPEPKAIKAELQDMVVQNGRK